MSRSIPSSLPPAAPGHAPDQPAPDAGCRAFFLVGPTAAGKTSVAHWIAEHHDYDVLSADSMLVYRGMDIGAAKPSAAERARVRYLGLDMVTLHEQFSAGDYRAAALQAIRETAAAGRRLIVTGGTGLYVKSLTHVLAPASPRNEQIRSRAEGLLAEQGIAALQEWLVQLDPARMQSLADPRNPRRLIRAIELAAGGETPAKSWEAAWTGPHIPGLMLPIASLYDRIQTRVERMYAEGLLDEVRQLMEQGLASAPTASKAIGYAEAMEVIGGRLTRAEAIDATAVRTRHLAKRQLTWFRNQANIDWLKSEASLPVEERARMVLDYWQAHGPTPIVG